MIVLDFLSHLFDKGLGYSAINTARSALSTFIFLNGKPIGQQPLVIRLLKGIYNKKPALPKTNVTWDPKIILDFLKKLSPVRSISLLNLSKKLATLLWLLAGQRGQSLEFIDLRNLTLTEHSVKIRFGDVLKTSRPGFQQSEIHIKAYAPDRRICLVTVLREYLKRTTKIRRSTSLFISTQKPHDSSSKDTITRWVKTVMVQAGLNMTIFTPHSIRAATTSAALKAKVPIGTILKTAGWSKDCTFRKYYKKPILQNTKFSEALLRS